MTAIGQYFRSGANRIPSHEWGGDEVIRLNFQCAALQRRLCDEAELRAEIESLQSKVLHLSGELATVRRERDRFAATIRTTADLSHDTLGG